MQLYCLTKQLNSELREEHPAVPQHSSASRYLSGEGCRNDIKTAAVDAGTVPSSCHGLPRPPSLALNRNPQPPLRLPLLSHVAEVMAEEELPQ